ncbi:hypothetical protein ACHWQZ_G017367 [Mnemiopsis leidyi]
MFDEAICKIHCMNFSKDSIRLRYGWEIDETPRICACGTKNSPYHALDCKLGGYVSMRHNSVRDTIVFFLREAKCRDVKVEPGMIPVNASHYKRSTITQDDARLDVLAVGVYSSFERSFLDIRVTRPNCASKEFKDLKQIYQSKKKPRNASHYKRSTITQDDARLDVLAVGVYSSFERSFLDIRVTHPNCASKEFKDLKQIYQSKKKPRKMHTKKGLYKQRKDHLCLSYLPHLEEWVHYATILSNNWWKNWRIIKTREQVS